MPRRRSCPCQSLPSACTGSPQWPRQKTPVGPWCLLRAGPVSAGAGPKAHEGAQQASWPGGWRRAGRQEQLGSATAVRRPPVRASHWTPCSHTAAEPGQGASRQSMRWKRLHELGAGGVWGGRPAPRRSCPWATPPALSASSPCVFQGAVYSFGGVQAGRLAAWAAGKGTVLARVEIAQMRGRQRPSCLSVHPSPTLTC